MNILCALAYSQIKRKKSRTVITIAAISLSTALLTAVINFAVSGNTMVRGFLGEDYGEFGGAYTLLLLIPAVILGALIIAMSVIVISNVFRMSANERVAQFGTLKCVGATKEQIYKTIMYECLILCTVAIPLGVVLGYLLSFVGRDEHSGKNNDQAGKFQPVLCFFSGSSSGICSDLRCYGVFCRYASGKKGHEDLCS